MAVGSGNSEDEDQRRSDERRRDGKRAERAAADIANPHRDLSGKRTWHGLTECDAVKERAAIHPLTRLHQVPLHVTDSCYRPAEPPSAKSQEVPQQRAKRRALALNSRRRLRRSRVLHPRTVLRQDRAHRRPADGRQAIDARRNAIDSCWTVRPSLVRAPSMTLVSPCLTTRSMRWRTPVPTSAWLSSRSCDGGTS